MNPRLTLILLFALFLAPIAVAVLLNSRWVDWQPAPDRSHGELIQPVVPLPDFQLSLADGETLTRTALADRWLLLQVEPGACDSDCEARAFTLRQIRASQNRHVPDIGLLLLAEEPIPTETAERIHVLEPGFGLAGGAGTEALRSVVPGAELGGFYIVDPDGNIIERFGLETDPTGIRKDLRRLLTWTVRE